MSAFVFAALALAVDEFDTATAAAVLAPTAVASAFLKAVRASSSSSSAVCRAVLASSTAAYAESMSAWTPDLFAFFKFAVAILRLVFAVFTAAYFS